MDQKPIREMGTTGTANNPHTEYNTEDLLNLLATKAHNEPCMLGQYINENIIPKVSDKNIIMLSLEDRASIYNFLVSMAYASNLLNNLSTEQDTIRNQLKLVRGYLMTSLVKYRDMRYKPTKICQMLTTLIYEKYQPVYTATRAINITLPKNISG